VDKIQEIKVRLKMAEIWAEMANDVEAEKQFRKIEELIVDAKAEQEEFKQILNGMFDDLPDHDGSTK